MGTDFQHYGGGAGRELAGEAGVDLGEPDEAGYLAGEEYFGFASIHLHCGRLRQERMGTLGGLTCRDWRGY